MKTIKMSLANIQGKMGRSEMRNIMAGSGNCQDTVCTSDSDCCTASPYCVEKPNWNNKTCYNHR